MKEEKQIAEETAKQIAEVSARHSNCKVIRLEVPVGQEGEEIAIGYIKKPNRIILDAVLSQAQIKPLTATETLLRSCWLEGDTRIIEDDDTFMNASAMLDQIIIVRKGEIKKN